MNSRDGTPESIEAQKQPVSSIGLRGYLWLITGFRYLGEGCVLSRSPSFCATYHEVLISGRGSTINFRCTIRIHHFLDQDNSLPQAISPCNELQGTA